VLAELTAAGYRPPPGAFQDDLVPLLQRAGVGGLGSLQEPNSLISAMQKLLRTQGRLP
jgi:hypothetical protein